MAANIINSAAQVKELVARIERSDPSYPFLFVDLEGINLSRHGSISIMQILVGPEKTVHLIDVLRLQRLAFETASDSGITLHHIFESDLYPKIFFDVRTDSDALYAHYNINLRCVVDLQLMEFITRPLRGQFVAGLTKCIEKDLVFSQQEVLHMKRVKEAGRAHFSPERGGRYEIFSARPLNSMLIEYCVQDVQFMPRLLMRYATRLQRTQAIQVQGETATRIQQSQATTPIRKGRHMAVGPSFVPVQTTIGQSISLAHPMDIICSPSLSTFCEPRETFDPFSNPNIPASSRSGTVQNIFGHSRHASLGPIQPPSEMASSLEPRRLSHPVLLNNQDRTLAPLHSLSLSAFSNLPMTTTFMAHDTIPAYANPLAPTTTSDPTAPMTMPHTLSPVSSGNLQDLSRLEMSGYEYGDEDLEMNGHYGSLSFLDEDDDTYNTSSVRRPGA